MVADVSDGQAAVDQAVRLAPDIAILDLTMPVLNGLEAARQIRRTSPRTRVIVLTVHADEHYVLDALAAGAKGYVLKTRAAGDITNAVEEVLKGNIYLSPPVSRLLVDDRLAGRVIGADPLTSRERQVLQLIAEGSTSKEVAVRLGVSTKTAETHRYHIMEKLNIHETAGLVRYAIRRGLIEP